MKTKLKLVTYIGNRASVKIVISHTQITQCQYPTCPTICKKTSISISLKALPLAITVHDLQVYRFSSTSGVQVK